MSSQPKTLLTEEQYLEIERAAEVRSEFYRGQMFAMAAASEAHNLIVRNLLMKATPQLLSQGCNIYFLDMRVRISVTGSYFYPDLAVVCGKPEFLKGPPDTLLNPKVVVEVLSQSTERWDRGRKFQNYKTIPSLEQYLLISSDNVFLDLYTRQPSGDWLLSSFDQLDQTVELQSVGCRLPVAELYQGVDLTA